MKHTKEFLINNKLYTFNIHIERRRSSRAALTKKGANIRIPRHISKQKQHEAIQEMITWAIKTIQKFPPKEEIEKIYKHLDIITVYDVPHTIYIMDDIREKNIAKVRGNIIEFKISHNTTEEEKQLYIRKKLRQIIQKLYIKEITERVHKINDLCFQKPINKVVIKYMKSKWGHCTSYGEICLSTRLLLAPKAVLNYVIVHELAHLIEMNHSKHFWNIVAKVDKTYKAKEKWLKEHGDGLVI